MALLGAKQSDVDKLLERVRAGDTAARDRLVTELYPELRQLARAVIHRVEYRRDHTLTPTALVSQLWIKMMALPLTGDGRTQLDKIPNSKVLLWTIQKNLEDILTDYARARRAHKRPTALTRVDLEQMQSIGDWVRDLSVDNLDVHQVLNELEKKKPDQARAMKLKYFMGYTIEEAAAALDIPVINYRRLCEKAEQFLHKRLTAVASGRRL
ncbi:MAG: hypothetical protein JNK87_41740 [Bryobacterales bacterium]|nr:hypothetical protein [Bryobacterales bacterium]